MLRKGKALPPLTAKGVAWEEREECKRADEQEERQQDGDDAMPGDPTNERSVDPFQHVWLLRRRLLHIDTPRSL